MKRKDLDELKTKTPKELRKMVLAKKAEAVKKKMRILGGREKNLKVYKNLRLEIARMLTLVREKEILEKLEAESKTGEVKKGKK